MLIILPARPNRLDKEPYLHDDLMSVFYIFGNRYSAPNF